MADVRDRRLIWERRPSLSPQIDPQMAVVARPATGERSFLMISKFDVSHTDHAPPFFGTKLLIESFKKLGFP